MPAAYYVYAIELDPAAARRAQDRALVAKGARCYYVGQTAHSDTRRLQDHLAGGWASATVVREHARQLVGHVGPFATRDEAEQQERAWAKKIRRLGHVAFGGH